MELKEAIDTLLKYKKAFVFQTDITNNDYAKSVDTVLEELDNYKWLIKSAKGFIEDNSHEFICKRDGGLPELEFDNNTNASDLLDILDGNY